MNNSAISCDDSKVTYSPEESSWTFYIQDFIMCQNYNNVHDHDHDQITSFFSELETPSLLSDASSSPVKKHKTNCPGKSNINCEPSVCKKQKIPVMSIDYDLEDTASSPVNTPKISYMNQLLMNEKEKGKIDVPEVKRNIFAKGGVFKAGKGTDYTGLKKKTCH